MAIAANFRKHADALIRQLELDFSGNRDAVWWNWLLEAGKPQPLARPKAPAWWQSLRSACQRLARMVRKAQFAFDLTSE